MFFLKLALQTVFFFHFNLYFFLTHPSDQEHIESVSERDTFKKKFCFVFFLELNKLATGPGRSAPQYSTKLWPKPARERERNTLLLCVVHCSFLNIRTLSTSDKNEDMITSVLIS